MGDQKKDLHVFLEAILKRDNLRIILTGAGSSAFIGEAGQGIIQKVTGKITEAIATTDIVTEPELFALKSKHTLFISFGRSGMSPESFISMALEDHYYKNG